MTETTEARDDEESGRKAALRELAQTTMLSVVQIGDPADVVRLVDLQDD